MSGILDKAGEVAVFDPGGATRLASARWSSPHTVTTATGTLRAGRALAQAIPHNGVRGGGFWAAHGEAFISTCLSVAGPLPARAQRRRNAVSQAEHHAGVSPVAMPNAAGAHIW
jgi:hypothetical protein